MEMRVDRLREAMELLGPVVPKKSTLPVLVNVLLKDGQAVAGDLETAVAVDLPEAEGECLVPYIPVADLLKSVKGDELLSLEQTGTTLNLAWSGGRATYEVPEPEDYPPLPQFEPALEATVDGDSLVRGLLSVVDCCATDDARPVLTGVTLLLGDPVEVAGADGYKLAIQTLPIALAVEGINQVIIPAATVRVLAHLWNKTPRIAPLSSSLVSVITAKKPIELALTRVRLRARFGAVTLVAQLIDGSPPNFRQLVPKDTPLTVRVFGPELERAVRRVQPVAKDNESIVRLAWSEDTLSVSAKSDGRETDTTVPVTAAGGPGKTALSANNLLGYLHGKEGMVELGVTDDKSPVLLRYGSSPLVVIMPMFVQW